MKIEIRGETLPTLTLTLKAKELVMTEHEQTLISVLDPSIIKTTSSTAKRLSPFFSKLIFGDAKVVDTYQATKAESIITFSALPNRQIVELTVTDKKPLVIKKGSLMAMTPGVKLTPRKKFNLFDALFGNDDLALQKVTGKGTIFVQVDLSAKTYNITKEKELSFDQAAVAYMDAGMQLSVKRTNIFKAFFFGGNDTIKYKVKGPGMIVVQNANTQRD
jgi:uncharacterized protein (AIM24 family)